MKTPIPALIVLASLALPGLPASIPAQQNESLRFSVNWPSGLSLGEGQLHATQARTAAGAPGRLNFEFSLDAGIPGFHVLDSYHSEASDSYCSAEFEKKFVHGNKKSDEKTIFDASSGTATRETKGGGKTELKTPSCGKDALAFLYYVRHELSQGRLPEPQTVFFGAPYEISLQFGGTRNIKIGDKSIEADRLLASLKGRSSETHFEIFFSKAPARTPLLVLVPLTLGTFSMELIQE
jgi:hypothetical protein